MVRKSLRNILDVLRKTKETLNGAGGRHRSGFQESTAARLYIHWKGHSMFSIAADNGKTSKLANKKKKIMSNFHFFSSKSTNFKIFVNKNGIKSLTPPEKFSFLAKSFQIEVFSWVFWKRETLLPKGWVFFLSFWLEFVPWGLVFAGAGVKKKSLI